MNCRLHQFTRKVIESDKNPQSCVFNKRLLQTSREPYPRRLPSTYERCTCENQINFRIGCCCISQIFTLRPISERRQMFRRPTISVFCDFITAFNSVIVQHFGAAPRLVMFRRKSSNSSLLWIWSAEAEFVCTAVIHPNSPGEMVFDRVTLFNLSFLTLSLILLWRYPCPHVRILPMTFA